MPLEFRHYVQEKPLAFRTNYCLRKVPPWTLKLLGISRNVLHLQKILRNLSQNICPKVPYWTGLVLSNTKENFTGPRLWGKLNAKIILSSNSEFPSVAICARDFLVWFLCTPPRGNFSAVKSLIKNESRIGNTATLTLENLKKKL